MKNWITQFDVQSFINCGQSGQKVKIDIRCFNIKKKTIHYILFLRGCGSVKMSHIENAR